MLKIGQKVISKLLMLVMCTSLASTAIAFSGVTNVVYASAATTSAESDFTFDKATGTITKYVGSGGAVVIPSTIKGVPVKIIGGSAFAKCDALTQITIPNGITRIEICTFWMCNNLKNVTLPNNITSIGDYAFGFCSSLASIIIPNSVTSIGDLAFYDSGLTNITIPKNVTSIGDYAFDYCEYLTKVTFSSNSVTSIGDSVFQGCTKLTSITIPKNVTSIGNNAFRDCNGLTSITIPSSVTGINRGAFSKCTNAKFYVESERMKSFLINDYFIDAHRIIVKA